MVSAQGSDSIDVDGSACGRGTPRGGSAAFFLSILLLLFVLSLTPVTVYSEEGGEPPVEQVVESPAPEGAGKTAGSGGKVQGVDPPGGGPWLGLTVESGSATLEGGTEEGEASGGEVQGLRVTGVSKDSPAQSGGLLVGDLITTLGGGTIKDITKDITRDDLVGEVARVGVGGEFEVEVVRGGRKVTLTVTLTPMPRSAATFGTIHRAVGHTSKGKTSYRVVDGGEGGKAGTRAVALEVAAPETEPVTKPEEEGIKAGRVQGGEGESSPGDLGGIFSALPLILKEAGHPMTDDHLSLYRRITVGYEKEVIRLGSSIDIGEIELRELLTSDPLALDEVEAKVYDLQSKRAAMLYYRLKTLDDVRGILSEEGKRVLNGLLDGVEYYR